MGIIEGLGWALALQFHAHKAGFLYRKDNKGPGIPVTSEERRAFVRGFGWQFVFHVAGFMLSVVAAAMLTARFFPKGDETGGFFLMGGLLAGIGVVLYLSLRHAMHAPSRALAGRAPSAEMRL